MTMELRHLRYFLAVAEELSFSSAADRLHITQPGLSRQIRAFEQAVGGTLFDRSKRRVILTPVGTALLDEARATLTQADKTLRYGKRAVAGVMGCFTVTYATALMLSAFLPALICRFRREWPGVDVDVEEMPSARQLVALREGHADVGFQSADVGASLVRHVGSGNDLAFEILWTEGVMATVSSAHPLARRKSIKLADLVDESIIAFPPGVASTPQAGPFARLERLRGAPLRIAQRVESVLTMASLAAAGMGVALLPESMMRLGLPRIRFIRIRDERKSRHIVLVYPRSLKRPTAANFINMAKRINASSRKAGLSGST